ncbi:hypothetical protein K3725_17315 [Leisingera sp. S132]|uniref:hypothetical protein n=1 Tax=Leisingera sp. S132 TaxID=2867016 RepID=UPI0021A2A833|nr:hypothetical protein [Leisingera sp. S132]UWQ81343.1 hypothetical protein K3725_17315 [Leisingera sp. S132]
MIATLSPRKSESIGKAMSPQNLCIEMAPFLAASRDSKEDAGSHAACDTVSGNCGKFVPGMAGKLLTKRGFRDQTKAGLAGSYVHQLN